MSYRCRLFKKREVVDGNLLGAYTEVWDSPESPIEYGLPHGEVDHVVVSDSWDNAREEMDRYCDDHDIYKRGTLERSRFVLTGSH